MLPNGTSKLLSNKRNEMTSKKRAFAELGMRAAMAANLFRAMDRDCSGKIDYTDLVSIFGYFDEVDFEKVRKCPAASFPAFFAGEKTPPP